MSLTLSEWPKEAVPHMHERIIKIAVHARVVTGCVMIPSPNPRAHVRFDDSTSLHSVGTDKTGFSYATDFFGRNDQATKMWEGLLGVQEIGGLGIYFDSHLNGKKRVMFHIDDRIKRGGRIMWLCPDSDHREYVYYHKDPVRFLMMLSNQFKAMRHW